MFNFHGNYQNKNISLQKQHSLYFLTKKHITHSTLFKYQQGITIDKIKYEW